MTLLPPKQEAKWWAKQRQRIKSPHATYAEFCADELSKMFKNPVKHNCETCVKVAYEALRDGRNGYVTDEELIESSRGRLRHK